MISDKSVSIIFFAESVGVDPNTFHSTSCFQDSPAGRRSSLSKIDTVGHAFSHSAIVSRISR